MGLFSKVASFFKKGNSNREKKHCGMCLQRLIDTDEICSSQNKKCPHIFHTECIVEWLMDDDRCPCCRLNYLEESGDDVDADGTSSADSSVAEIQFQQKNQEASSSFSLLATNITEGGKEGQYRRESISYNEADETMVISGTGVVNKRKSMVDVHFDMV